MHIHGTSIAVYEVKRRAQELDLDLGLSGFSKDPSEKLY